MQEDQGLSELSFEYLLWADGAQVVGGKLYVLGGGWDRLQLPDYPATISVALAMGVRVPWNQANRQHHFVVRGMTADQNKEFFSVEGSFEAGRPAGMPPGWSQLVQVALVVPLAVPEPGQYLMEAIIDDKIRRVYPYYAVKVTA